MPVDMRCPACSLPVVGRSDIRATFPRPMPTACARCGTPVVYDRTADELGMTSFRRPAPTVAAYFASELGVAMLDPQKQASDPDFTTDTECGADCAAVIDAAAALLGALANAFGSSKPGYRDTIIAACNSICECYIYG